MNLSDNDHERSIPPEGIDLAPEPKDLRARVVEALLAACDPQIQVNSWMRNHGPDGLLAWAPGSLGDGPREARPLAIGEIADAVLPVLEGVSDDSR